MCFTVVLYGPFNKLVEYKLSKYFRFLCVLLYFHLKKGWVMNDFPSIERVQAKGLMKSRVMCKDMSTH